MKDSPASWLASAIDVIAASNKDNPPFKVVRTDSYTNGAVVLRVLNRNTGAVWRFTCEEEREPV